MYNFKVNDHVKSTNPADPFTGKVLSLQTNAKLMVQVDGLKGLIKVVEPSKVELIGGTPYVSPNSPQPAPQPVSAPVVSAPTVVTPAPADVLKEPYPRTEAYVEDDPLHAKNQTNQANAAQAEEQTGGEQDATDAGQK